MTKPATRKNKTCKSCGGDLFKHSFDKNDNPVWECACCFNQTPRQVRVSKKQKEINNLFDDLVI